MSWKDELRYGEIKKIERMFDHAQEITNVTRILDSECNPYYNNLGHMITYRLSVEFRYNNKLFRSHISNRDTGLKITGKMLSAMK